MFEFILFVHKDIETRSIFYEIFTNLGYKIITAIAYRDILEILKKDPII